MRRPEPPSVVAALLFSGCTCAGRLPGKNAVRPPEQADVFYPADPKELRRQLDQLLADAKPVDGPVQAVIVPHAAMQWSGRVAAATLGALKDHKFRRIVVLGEKHAGTWEGAALPAEGGLGTPLGASRVDERAVDLLAGYPGFARCAAAYDGEYVIEVLLPFLQRLWPEVPVVPVILGHTDPGEREGYARSLRNVLDEGTLLVMTATLTHFGDEAGQPFELRGGKQDIDQALFAFEQPVVEALLARDAKAFEKARRERPSRSCGYGALEVGLAALGPGDPGRELARASSLDVLFDPSDISGVSYLGVAYPGRWPAVAALDSEDRRVLSRIAEEGVAAAVAGQDAPPLGELSPRLKQRGGAFVTLTQRGMLRGCMGRLDAESVAFAVAAAAHMAARSDPRFNPILPADLPTIDLEISVLGPFEVIAAPEEFEPGRHGLLLTRGYNVEDGARGVPRGAGRQGRARAGRLARRDAAALRSGRVRAQARRPGLSRVQLQPLATAARMSRWMASRERGAPLFSTVRMRRQPGPRAWRRYSASAARRWARSASSSSSCLRV